MKWERPEFSKIFLSNEVSNTMFPPDGDIKREVLMDVDAENVLRRRLGELFMISESGTWIGTMKQRHPWIAEHINDAVIVKSINLEKIDRLLVWTDNQWLLFTVF